MRLNYYTEEEENYTIRIMLISPQKKPVETQMGKCDLNYNTEERGWRAGIVVKGLHSKHTSG